MTDGWHRLAPVSPVVRAGRAAIAITVLLLPTALRGGDLRQDWPQLAVVGVLLVLGVVSWLVTRWRIDGDDLRIETGLLRRQSLRFPLAQVQAVDVVRPGLVRVFRVAELRLRMAGATGATARLAYLPEREVEPLRTRLLALAHGETSGRTPVEEVDERVLASVPTGRLAASILLSDVGFASAGLLTLRQTIGVILGADVGTTVTVQLLAFEFLEVSPLVVFIGWFLPTAGPEPPGRVPTPED